MKIRIQDLLYKLQEIPFFAELDEDFLVEFILSTDLRLYRKNELICAEGEYEEICYIILSGSVGVWVKNKSGQKEQVAFLGSGEIFGEIATLSGNPRIAAIISNELSEILYLDKKALFTLMDYSKEFKTFTQKRYRERLLKTELKKIKIFEGLPNIFFDKIIENVDLLTYQMGETILSYGDEANDFFLIIFGFAKVLIPYPEKNRNQNSELSNSQSLSGQKEQDFNFMITSYLAPGYYFGEIGLIEKRKRIASVSSLTRLELIKIDKFKFHSILSSYCDVEDLLEKVIANRRQNNVQLRKDESYERLLDWAVSSNIIQSNAVLIIDLNKCIKCETCIDTCEKLFGTSRLFLNGLKFDNLLVPTSCRHCHEPLCLVGCPTGAISRDFSGEVYHKSFCIGCGNCARRCPYGNIIIVNRKEKRHKPYISTINKLFFKKSSEGNSRGASIKIIDVEKDDIKNSLSIQKPDAALLENIATKCDNCKDFPYMGCVQNCPRGAAQKVNPREYFKEIMPV